MLENQKFLGRGWSFPPSFTRKILPDHTVLAELQMVEAREDIEQSLAILLSTSLGERIMQPKYGCNLSDFQFEPINAAFVGRMRDLISSAILYYEPRIELTEIDISTSGGAEALEGKLVIDLTYIIRSTNSRFNYVFNFYVNEASGLTF